MGSLRFSICRPEDLGERVEELAYMAGADDVPWQSEILWTEDGLCVERDEHDSGCFHVPWRVAGHGQLLLSTATLMERRQPYHLAIEIARGTLNRLRNQLAQWQAAGMQIAPELTAAIQSTSKLFAQAVSWQEEPLVAAEHASRAIESGLAALRLIAEHYTVQALEVRRKPGAKLPVLMGGCLDGRLLDPNRAEPFLAAFNSAAISFNWRKIEAEEGERHWAPFDSQVAWCQSRHLRVCGGPLIRFDRKYVPDWLYLWEGDYHNLVALASEHVQKTVTRYKGKVALWQCAAGLQTGTDFGFSEEQQLRMAVRLIEVTAASDPKAPVLLAFDQPWAEYMGRREVDLSPLHFADTLARAEVGLSGIALEIDFGWSAKQTLPRDLVELNRLIDRWTCLGLPLLLSLRLPDADTFGADESRWLKDAVSLLLAKQSVQGIFWNPRHSGATAGSRSAESTDGLLRELALLREQYLS